MIVKSRERSPSFQVGPLITTDTQYILPPIEYWGPIKVHPDYPEIYEKNTTWVRKYILRSENQKIVESLLESRIPFFDCMVYPFCIADRVFQFSCVASLMVAMDDFSDLQRVDFDDISKNCKTGNFYGRAFSAAFEPLERAMPDRLYRRYIQSWKDVFISGSEERELRERKVTLDLDTYLRIRRVSAGVWPYIIGAEYGLNIDLTDLFAKDHGFQIVQNLVSENFVLVNDLFSFRKELFKSDLVNMVAILMSVYGHNLQGAIDVICERIGFTNRALIKGCTELRRRYANRPYNVEIYAYLDTLETICSGNFRWSLETTRYHGRGYIWNGLRSGTVTINPDVDRISPR